MADIWHEHSELPSLGSKVIVKNKQYSTWNNVSKIDLEEMAQDGLRWRYTSDPDSWTDFPGLPAENTDVVVENKQCRVWILSNGPKQVRFANSPAIDVWAFWADALAIKTGTSNKILNGIKEGEENDWAPTINGYVQMEHDIYMLRQQINARLQTLPNEVDGFDGIDYLNIIFGNTSWAVKAQTLIEVVQNIPAVNDVLYVSANWIDKEKGEFKMTFVVNSLFGKLNFAFGINEQNKTITLN